MKHPTLDTNTKKKKYNKMALFHTKDFHFITQAYSEFSYFISFIRVFSP